MSTPPLNFPTICLFLAVLAVTGLIIYAARSLYNALTQTHAQRLRTEAHRLMLRFCKNPTPGNFTAVWSFIDDNDVWVSELDQPLVRRFRSMSKGMKEDVK